MREREIEIFLNLLERSEMNVTLLNLLRVRIDALVSYYVTIIFHFTFVIFVVVVVVVFPIL